MRLIDLFANPRTQDRNLWVFVADRFGMKLPFRTFTQGHSSPFEFLADAFFNPSADVAAWACRSGGKTLVASLLAGLEFLTAADRQLAMQVRVLSGSEDQARNLYGYWQQWALGPLRHLIRGSVHRIETSVGGGKFQILAASQKKVRGAKVQRLYEDEVDEIPPELAEAALGMMDSRPHLPSRTVYTSTWHKAHGPMGRLIDGCPGNGVRLHKWNLWEAIERCPEQRHDGGRNCQTCLLGPTCLAKARQLDPGAKVGVASQQRHGLYAIDDAVKVYQQASEQFWDAEMLCRRPSLSGLVYPQFDRAVHVVAGLDFSEDLPTFRAIDFGLNDFVCLWLQVDKRGTVCLVDEYWAADATLAANAAAIVEADKDVRIEATYVDPAGRNRNDQTGYSDVQVLRGAGIPCEYSVSPWAREVANGVNLIRAHLKPAAGKPRLYVAAKCRQTIRAFESYRLRQVNGEWVDEPLKPQPCDHPMDALRYFFVNRRQAARSPTRQWGFVG